MVCKIISTEKISAASAKDVAVNGRAFIISNITADSAIYFKEKAGTAATANNAQPLAAGATFPHVLRAETLSVYGGNAQILYVREE